VSASADGELLRRFLGRRDEDDFRRLYAAHAPAMYLLALRLAGGQREAEDVVQDAWLRVAAGVAVYEGRAPLRTWLCGIVVNCARERRRGPLFVELEDAPHTPGEHFDLERAVRDLPDGFRHVLVLHDLCGYTHEEIASLLGIEPGTSKSQLSRARRRVRERIMETPR
jgi:RNA polymerase sigma-70 factor (ECF subfamily)